VLSTVVGERDEVRALAVVSVGHLLPPSLCSTIWSGSIGKPETSGRIHIEMRL
jgi:hypothetical protein